MPISIDDSNGNIIAGGGNSDGDLVLRNDAGADRIHLDAGGGNAWFGGNGVNGDAVLLPLSANNHTVAEATIHLDGGGGSIFLGGNGTEGDVVLRGLDGRDRIHLDAGGGNAWFGGNGVNGDAVLLPLSANNHTVAEATVHHDGGSGNMFLGGNGTEGDVVLRGGDGRNRIHLDAGGGSAWFGGNGVDGDAVFFSASGDNQTLSQATIHIDGASGDIILQNADCAEDFDIAQSETVEPGMAVVLGDDGLLHPCGLQYDTRVIGIIAGGGHLRPGIILGRQNECPNRLPVALVGRVSCKADTSNGIINVGDLLTTSSMPGHVMRATDQRRAFGAIVGKALTGLVVGPGMIEVVVALQ